MKDLVQDLRYAVRTLIQRPGFTIVACLALALGIGANSAIFSVVNAVLLEPLPYPKADRLAFVFENSTRVGRFSVSYPNYLDWRAQQTVFDEIAAIMRSTYNLTEGEAERLGAMSVTDNFFGVLQVQPALGRGFLPEETKPGGPKVAVLTDELWRRRFAADPSVVGRAVSLNGEKFTVVGVTPAGFKFSRNVELYTPLALDPAENSRGAHFLGAVGRLKSELSAAQAEAAMDAIAKQLEQQYPASNTGWDTTVVPMHEQVVGRVRAALMVLLGAVGCVLLIACANVANLLLARAATREKEIAVRTALGASRWRLVRQMLTESVLLSVLGAALGLLAAYWALDLLRAWKPENLPRIESIGVDGTVLGFTLGLSLLTGLLFGLVPALQSTRTELTETLKEGGGKATAGRQRHRVRGALVVSEVAIALVLLVGAGLLIKSFARLADVDPGFRPGGLLTASLTVPETAYPDETRRSAFLSQVQQRVAGLPGVESVTMIDNLPLSGGANYLSFNIDGRPVPPPGEEISSMIHGLGADYVRTMGIPLLRGRDMTEAEAWGDSQVILINEAMAGKFWPGEEALGARINFGSAEDPKWLTVVGVVGDVRHQGLDEDPSPEVYLPYWRWASADMTLAVRTAGPPAALVPAVRELIRGMDPALPIYEVSTMEQVVAGSIAGPRFNLVLLGFFAALALLLAVLGIYGVMSYVVTERTREVGIRMALGARRGDVLGMLLRQGLSLVLIGLLIGLAGAFGLSRVLASLMYGVSVTDPVVFVTVPLVLATVAAASILVPARRATKVDPMSALRHE